MFRPMRTQGLGSSGVELGVCQLLAKALFRGTCTSREQAPNSWRVASK